MALADAAKLRYINGNIKLLHLNKIDHLFGDCSPMLKRLRVLESFVNVDSSVVRFLALAMLRQHVDVALALTLVVTA